jgi:hypothetical protein
MIYIDDILCMHHDPMTILNLINGYMPLKPTSVGNPDIYLGAKLRQTRMPNGVWAWGLSPSKYVVQAVKNRQTHMTEKLHDRYCLPSRADNPSQVIMLPKCTRPNHLTLNARHSTNTSLV